MKIGSNGNSGSPGKYICVTRRVRKVGPNSEKWICAGRQAFVVVPPRIGAGLDGDEAVAALGIGDGASGAGEIRVERGRVLVDDVDVAPGGVRLPDLDQRVRHAAGRPRP